jgi:hypothetical protein
MGREWQELIGLLLVQPLEHNEEKVNYETTLSQRNSEEKGHSKASAF